ncbi:DUF58 domain-containing protein [Thermococcus pacificus]|uniref:DUF58 domain-containing protein n=1 Tax=Thermococcus pacificus TaxID=71998 RepID=A0A218P6I1_9EURY|nr:DUF58 domain-containing protein [Thermococcus pacificus]ASJ06370.1 hypothetical protein A3L08_02995 [Thermococcus pacificus]
MKRAEVVLSLAAVVAGTAYLLGSPAAALIGVALMAHYSLARMAFKPKVRVERSLPERGTEREPVKARVRIENLSDVAGLVRVRETSEKAFARGLKAFVRPGERKYLEQTVVPQAKGRINLKAEAVFEDELGLFRASFPVIGRGEMAVFPSQRSIREAMREKRQVEALAEAERALGIGAETLEFQELREFLPGDDITKIDWKATSRLQKLIIRVFKRETMADIYLLINVDPRFRRELKAGKTDYLVLIIAQLTAYFRRFGHGIKVLAYDEHGIVRAIENPLDPLSVVHELGLRAERGLPALRPAKVSRGSSLGTLVARLKSGSEAHGVLKAALKVPAGSYVIVVDDLGLHPGEIMKASRLLERRGSKVVLLYPNPVFFVDKSTLSEDEVEVLYNAYRERKELMKKVMGWVKVIEVGPKDLLPVVVSRL